MEDLTKGSIACNLARMTGFMLVGMVFQTAYFLVDLYFVGRLGKTAVAAVSLSGNLMFVVLHGRGGRPPARRRGRRPGLPVPPPAMKKVSTRLSIRRRQLRRHHGSRTHIQPGGRRCDSW